MTMSKDERNRRRREAYAKKRAAGLTRSQIRSQKKAIQKDPNILEKAASVLSEAIKKAVKDLIPTEKKKPQAGQSKAVKEKTKTKKSASGQGRKKSRVKYNETVEAVRVFLEGYKGKLTSRHVGRAFRSQGGEASHEAIQEALRHYKGQPFKDVSKMTKPIVHRMQYSKDGKYYFDAYTYIVAYSMTDGNVYHVTITNSSELRRPQVLERFMEFFTKNTTLEKYKASHLLPDTIQIIDAVYNPDYDTVINPLAKLIEKKKGGRRNAKGA